MKQLTKEETQLVDRLVRKIKIRASKIKPGQYGQALGVKTGLELAAEMIEAIK